MSNMPKRGIWLLLLKKVLLIYYFNHVNSSEWIQHNVFIFIWYKVGHTRYVFNPPIKTGWKKVKYWNFKLKLKLVRSTTNTKRINKNCLRMYKMLWKNQICSSKKVIVILKSSKWTETPKIYYSKYLMVHNCLVKWEGVNINNYDYKMIFRKMRK